MGVVNISTNTNMYDDRTRISFIWKKEENEETFRTEWSNLIVDIIIYLKFLCDLLLYWSNLIWQVINIPGVVWGLNMASNNPSEGEKNNFNLNVKKCRQN